ncbi:hypothetical protein OAA39_00460 [bacterium]|nr:hypothetical protein [bacterium]
MATTTYSFNLPVVGSDNDTWGTKLNENWDKTDDLFDGTLGVSGIDINGGSIDGTPIGAASASTGAFTTISASGDITGNVTGNVKGDIKATDGTVVLNNGTDGTDATFTGNAATATTTATPRAFSVSGDVATSAGVDFDGSGAVDLAVAITDTLWDKIYPVGSIYATTEASFDPNTSFYGTWSEYAAGRVLVGQDTGDTDFDTINETGGAKTHTLIVDEMPSHQHNSNVMSEDTRAYIGDTYALSHKGLDIGSHGTQAPKTSNTGGGQAHNNLQPYTVVKYWRRTG